MPHLYRNSQKMSLLSGDMIEAVLVSNCLSCICSRREPTQKRHPCNGATPPDALRAGLGDSGHPARREASVQAGQLKDAAP